MDVSAKQAKELSQTPAMSRGLVDRAFRGVASPRQSIKARCLQCVGFVRKDVANCTAPTCALWPYRPYQTADDDAAEAMEEPGEEDGTE